MLLVDLALKLRDQPLSRLLTLWPGSAAALVYLLLVVMLLAWGATRPLSHLRRVALGLLLLEAAPAGGPDAAWCRRRARFRTTEPVSLELKDSLCSVTANRGRPSVRLGLVARALHVVAPGGRVALRDLAVHRRRLPFRAQTRPALQTRHAEMLMRDLRERGPRFIVDAWRRSWTMVASGDPSIYRLDRYPDFELPRFLERHYDLEGTLDGCELWVRRPDPAATPR